MRTYNWMFVLVIFAIFSNVTRAETWDDNLWIELPTAHDVMSSKVNELECLALNIYFEARGETVFGQAMVAQVTMNRLRAAFFPDTVCGVVRQDQQFSWTHDGKSDRPEDYESYVTAYKLAIQFMYMGKTASVPYARDLVNYHNDTVNPDWSNMEAVLDVGRHRFYRRAKLG